MSSFRKKIKNNIPRVELQSIMTLVVGGFKSGKTRLWKEVTELHYKNPEEALLLAFEDGYETWELENIVPLHEEGTDKDLWKVWDYFKKTITPELVKEAKDGRIVKLIGVDTADRAIAACTAWVLHNREKKYGKTFASLQDISDKTNENGWTILGDELRKPFDTLKGAGYGLFVLGWTKEKETTLYNGLKYNSIKLMMSETGRKVFESQASLICCLHNEVEVFDKQGNVLEENVKDKKGRDKATNFHESKTMMYFRPSEYVGIGGGRYTELPEKVEYSAENFLKVFKEAVKGQLKTTKRTVQELKEKEKEEREDKAQDLAEKMENDPYELFSQVEDLIKSMDNEQKKKAAEKFKEEFGVRNYVQEKGNAENLKKVLDIVQTIINESLEG